MARLQQRELVVMDVLREEGGSTRAMPWEQASLSSFLDVVLSTHRDAPEERRVRTSLKRSGLSTVKTLESFDFTFVRGVDLRKLKLVATVILDRLLHHCQVVQIDGRSYLLREVPSWGTEARGRSGRRALGSLWGTTRKEQPRSTTLLHQRHP